MSTELWLAYAGLSLLFAVTPGPAVILAVSQAVARGFRAGMGVTAGVQVGNSFYFAISAGGLGAIIATSQTAFLAIKYAGAAYLIYLGIWTIANARRSASEESQARQLPLWRRPFVQGLVNQLGNPKSILFYGALLPQFIDAGAPLLPQLTILAITPVVIEVPILALYVGAAASGRRYLRGPSSAVWRERAAGSALVAAGAALSLVRRTS
ncbi:MAG TPA: LysE family translocator [Sphingomicrobium sp.]|nr:LysE family translocator [Sphingomicrobium sp.]